MCRWVSTIHAIRNGLNWAEYWIFQTSDVRLVAPSLILPQFSIHLSLLLEWAPPLTLSSIGSHRIPLALLAFVRTSPC